MSPSAEVLVTDHVFGDLEAERAALAEIGATLTEDPDALARADALLVCFAQVPAAMIEAAEHCRIIARYGIGVDNVDVSAATERGILVTNVPDYCLDEVADHALALLLGAARGVVAAAADVRAGAWRVPQGAIHRLRGRRLALLGGGRIGQRVAERARAFGFEVVVYDPYLPDSAGFEEAITDADAISLHAPLTPETRQLIDAAAIALMRRAPILVNTSRGGLVDLDAVVRGLDSGALGAVALDVTEPEPLPADHVLCTHPRAIITPHMAFTSVEAQAELQRRAVEEVVRALTGRAPRCPVNREVFLTRIDVHNHAIPERAIELLNAEAVYGATVRDGLWQGGVHVPFALAPSFLDADAKLAELEAAELEAAVISVSPTLFYYHVDADAGEAMARAVNGGLEEMAAAWPDRLRWMASVPLQDPARAVAVLEEAAANGAVGVEIGTSVAGAPLDALDTFWAAAERLSLPVMLHPAYPNPHPLLKDFYLENVIGFPLETTIAIERLICAGTLDRHPGLRVVLLHAGGYFPWQAGRLRHARTVRPELAEAPRDPWSYVGRVLLDPITHDAGALRFLVAKAGAENLVLGTDLPFDMATPGPLAALRAACDAATVTRIAEDNPAALYFSRRTAACRR